MRALFFLLFLCLSALSAQAQQDTIRSRHLEPDTGTVRTRAEHDSAQSEAPIAKTDSIVRSHYWGKPQKAALYSAILPGAGQVYNKEIWKVPIIYAGAAILAYFWVSNSQEYYKFDRVLDYRGKIIDKTPVGTTAVYYDQYAKTYTNSQLIRLRDYYRRNRDFTVIITGLTYLLQIADAHVFAHLKGFNVDDNLSWRPTVIPMQGQATILRPVSPGISLTLRLP